MSNLSNITHFFSKKSNPTQVNSAATAKPNNTVPEDSLLKRHFLTHLRSVIEAEIIPETMDLSLKHYYDAAIAAEFQKRLAHMTQ